MAPTIRPGGGVARAERVADQNRRPKGVTQAHCIQCEIRNGEDPHQGIGESAKWGDACGACLLPFLLKAVRQPALAAPATTIARRRGAP